MESVCETCKKGINCFNYNAWNHQWVYNSKFNSENVCYIHTKYVDYSNYATDKNNATKSIPIYSS